MVLGQHVMTHEAGTIGTKAGRILSAGDSIEITLHGSGAHGSMPHLSVDPVVLASTIVMRLQTVASREIPPSSFAVLTVGSIQAGSESNSIPATATLLLNMRTYDEDVRSTMITALERIVRGECEAAGWPQEPEFRYYDQYPLTDNDNDVSAKVTEALRAQFGEAVFEQTPQTASRRPRPATIPRIRSHRTTRRSSTRTSIRPWSAARRLSWRPRWPGWADPSPLSSRPHQRSPSVVMACIGAPQSSGRVLD